MQHYILDFNSRDRSVRYIGFIVFDSKDPKLDIAYEAATVETVRVAVNNHQQMLDALKLAEDSLADIKRIVGDWDSVDETRLQAVRAAIQAAEGGGS